MRLVCYGVLGRDGGFIETSATSRGAKNHATRNGYAEVYAMHCNSWAVWLVATKTDKGWKNAK